MRVGQAIELLLAEREIRSVLYRYCRAIDRGDRELMRSLYHPDAKEEHGTYAGDLDGFLDYAFATLDMAGEGLSHHITNILVEVRHDEAFAESAFIALSSRLRGFAEDEVDLVIVGRYLDTFERRGGLWKIAHRKVVFDANHTFPPSSAWTGPLYGGFAPKGLPDHGDALFEAMALAFGERPGAEVPARNPKFEKMREESKKIMDIKNHPLLRKHEHHIPGSIENNDPPMMAAIATLRAKPGHADKLKEVLAVACSLVRVHEPDIRQYHAMQSREDPHIFKMFEVYRNQAALDHHISGTPYIAELYPMIMEALASDPEVEWLDSIFD